MTRIVHCPGCKELLVEPTAGVTIYQCGNCLTVLIAKHARSSLAVAADQNQNNAAAAAAAAKASTPSPPPPPPPLYKHRERQPIAIPNPSPLPGNPLDASASPLYTPRNGIGSGSGRMSSAAAPAPAPAAIDEDNSLLLQDMRKLAREAFPAQVQAPEDGKNATTRLASSNGSSAGNGGRMTRQELDEFTFPRQARDLDAMSDYHSTLEELDSSAQSDDLRRKSCVHDLHPVEAPTSTAATETGEDLRCNAAARRSRNSSSSSDALGGHEEDHHLAMVAVTPGPAGNKKKRAYPPLNSPYVVCQHCDKLLEVPRSLPPSKTSVQKLRCGACHSISKFALADVEHERKQQPGIVPVDSFDRSSGGSTMKNASGIDHNRKMDMVAMMMSSSSSPVPGSAPASYHAAHFHLQKRITDNITSNSKGYESAPEFHHGASASTPSSHARTISAGSSSTVPLAPCLHELFGYESPSQFLKVADNKSTRSSTKSSSETSPKPKAGGGGIKALLLKSIQEISKLHFQQQHYSVVTINGATIPDELVRKAEELAGPIHPGNYWYDYRAGFWGVMGGPCIGIVPPCIEEFKHPAMPVNCAGGKTGVVINGRELHQQDLQVLVKRGLPSTPNTSYTIDIDGVVVDLATGNEIRCLGKLAPSIEKRGVGFGMFPLSRGLT
ncbi:hypothetical protein SELMODRAFT_428331 [Selaginella moellendorffii]|uniref:Uncharacterized protein n=1 Tax=Selaginella moellendorffii TaxID=88036 RepID=D8T2H5_SELML|nr:uncharacterized protein LOC9629023 [Selaginella moellendorffii]EFJ09100.1 hypothetical protein SELMODRAFT_428331 [Selaginella moellendorffii]|eukprot:XP_002989833.1 uncharacterized protein LOC9629023 [Selaginella moellendorffii]